jgi:hypothetical protein
MRLTSAAALLPFAVAISAYAAFTGITVTATTGPSSTPLGATTIYRMWANFDATGGGVQSVSNFRIIAQTGFTGFVHNDNYSGGGYSIVGGSWHTGFSNAAFGATDSWVCVTEPSTFPSYSAIADGSTWAIPDYATNAQIPGISGAGVRWSSDPSGPYFNVGGQQLLGQFVIASSAQVCLAATCYGYSTNSWVGGGPTFNTNVAFDFNGNCVPAPGALALLGFAGFARRRTR